MAFVAGGTVICKAIVRDEDGVLVDPATSMKIGITDKNNTVVVAPVAMSKDSTGIYHYDWATTSATKTGMYKTTYTAVDGTRTTIANSRVEIMD